MPPNSKRVADPRVKEPTPIATTPAPILGRRASEEARRFRSRRYARAKQIGHRRRDRSAPRSASRNDAGRHHLRRRHAAVRAASARPPRQGRTAGKPFDSPDVRNEVLAVSRRVAHTVLRGPQPRRETKNRGVRSTTPSRLRVSRSTKCGASKFRIAGRRLRTRLSVSKLRSMKRANGIPILQSARRSRLCSRFPSLSSR